MNVTLTDSTDLNHIFLRIRQSLMWSVIRIVKDQHIAEDLAQDTYLRARRAIDKGPIDHPEAFLHQTARNLAIDYQRHKTLVGSVLCSAATETDAEKVPAHTWSPEDSLIQRERLSHLYAALDQLPPRTKRAWILSRIERWSQGEIASHLGVSPNTIYNDLKMAMGCCHDALARLDKA